MPIVGGLDIDRKQITFDYVDLDRGGPARPDRSGRPGAPAAVAARFAGRDQVAFALEG